MVHQCARPASNSIDMSTSNDASIAETAQSDPYLPATQQHQQQQQQHQQQQQYFQHYNKQTTQCILHIPTTPQQQQHNNNANKWLPQQQQQQQQHQQLDDDTNWQQHQHQQQNKQNISRTYITPADIPPPPPHPTSSIVGVGSKRFHPQRLSGRCQCEHPIELKSSTGTGIGIGTGGGGGGAGVGGASASIGVVSALTNNSSANNNNNTSSNSNAYHPNCTANHNHHTNHIQALTTSHQYTHQHSHQHRLPHNCPHNHLPMPPPSATATNSTREHHLMQTGGAFGGGGGGSLQTNNKTANHYLPSRNSYHLHQQQQHQQQHFTPTHKKKNLVYSNEKIRRLRIILGTIAGIVIAILLGVALYFIITGIANPLEETPKAEENAIHLEDILTGQLAAQRFNGTWSSGSSITYREGHTIMEYDVKTKTKTALFTDDKQQYVSHEKSPDGSLILLAKNYKKNFRHSYEAEYDIYNISSGKTEPLLIKGDQKSLIMVQWAPLGNALIVNFERNLYYKPSAFADEVAITSDENPAILNGIPDWVYEEEVFSSNSATWFNPNGSMIAFIKFDDSPTHVINFPYYGEAGDLRYQYPYNRLVAYPKAGSSNPRVRLFTADLILAAEGKDFITEIIVPSELNTETDYLITVVDWLDNDNVLSVWMNRVQNLAYMQVSDGLKRHEIHSMDVKNGWVDLFTAPFKNQNGTRIALILPQQQDDGTNYRHLCTLSTGSLSTPEAITKGKYVVQSILHWDTDSNVIFYTANTESNSEVLHVYAVRATTGQTPKCLTCKLQTSGSVEQTYYSADFNNDHQVLISSLGPGIPMHYIYDWSYTNRQVDLKELVAWETNENLRAKLKNVAMPTLEIHTISIGDGFTAKILLQLPPNMDRSGNTKYPMLVDVYGGPDSYSVVDKWIMDWGTYLSSNQSVIYAKIDGRGSGLRGDKLLHAIYLKLGTAEITDQIDVAKALQQKFDFIDEDHTGIWGWSYGGYAAAMALANDDSLVFKCAASIAPVTDWAYYDSIYTERYMRLPTDNAVGYANARLSTRAQNLRNKKFLLVHGTLDDNVHYQQAMILAKNLERHDILFKQISYPDEDHGLGGVRPHLYHSLDRFFGDCFDSKRMAESRR